MVTIDDVIGNMLPERATSLLRCPSCQSAMRRENSALTCSSCAKAFAIARGVPFLLDETRSSFRLPGVPRARAQAVTRRSWISIGKRWGPTIEFNLTGRDSMLRFRARLLAQATRPIVLNIGGKHAGSFSVLVATDPAVDCIELHVALAPRTNLIADPHALPLADGSVDAVIIDAVLEHMIDPVRVAEEIFRVLKTDGLVYADSPFMVPVHGGTHDFLRFSPLAHRRLFRHFRHVESGISGGPGSALALSIQAFMLSFVRSAGGRAAAKVLCRLGFFWLKYFDHVLKDRPGSWDAALGTYFVGQKHAQPVTDRDLVQQYPGTSPRWASQFDGDPA
jgi:SAM-dependent methyltransferase/uncharacterized protein YbaR (Trm112 family)